MLEVELQEMKSVSEAVAEEIPTSVDPPYSDFFNRQLMRKIDLEIHSRTPPKIGGNWGESLRWAWAPVGALALVLSFFRWKRCCAFGNRLGESQNEGVPLPQVS